MTHSSGLMAANVDDWFRDGVAAARAGQRERARDLLTRVVAKDRRNLQAWLWLSDVVDDPAAKAHCLERVLVLDPEHEQARQSLARLRSPAADTRPAGPVSTPPTASELSGPAPSSALRVATDPAATAGSAPRASARLAARPDSQDGTLAATERGFFLGNEFLLVGILGLVLLALIVAAEVIVAEPLALPLAISRLSLGLAFVLFAPGYALQAALFPRAGELDGPERLALSFGLSVAVVPPLALILDALPWGIRLWPIVVAEVLIIAVCASVALWRRGRLPAEEQFRVVVDLDARGFWAGQDWTGRILYGILAFALLLAAGSALAILLAPKPGEHFTEFYALGAEGLAESYPREVVAGQPVTVTAGIANREGETAEYRIEVSVDGELIGAESPIALEDGEVWEGQVTYALPWADDDQQVLFLLYRDGGSEPYRTLRLWVNVVEE